MKSLRHSTNKGFTREELKNQYIKCLKNFNECYSRLVEYAFDEKYFTDGDEALKALEEYGIFAAITRVKQYEEEDFGTLTTDLSNPVEVANSLFYILGEELLYYDADFFDLFQNHEDDLIATEQVNKEFIKVIERI